jgi:hypothetical protein
MGLGLTDVRSTHHTCSSRDATGIVNAWMCLLTDAGCIRRRRGRTEAATLMVESIELSLTEGQSLRNRQGWA